MDDSILDSTKKALGLAKDYTPFDVDVIMHLNSVLATLNQLGLGPAEGMLVEDSTSTWGDFLGTAFKNYTMAKSLAYLRVRLLFDPPATSFALDAMKEQIKEYEWRLSVAREENEWVDPTPPPPEGEETWTMDGGYV